MNLNSRIMFLLLVLGVVFVSGCTGNQVTPAHEEEHRALIIDIPSSVQTGETFSITWEVPSDEPETISHTAIHYDTQSHPGNFGLDVAPGDSGYTELTPDFASGEFTIPDTFTVSITAPNISGTLYLRAHSIIEGDNFWTSERTIAVTSPEIPGNETAENTVQITAAGFSPSTITISAGEAVTWTNADILPAWPASDVHPTHTNYPGSSISKCGGPEESSIFDACTSLAQGETYTFTFNEAGTWEYHNHLSPGMKGTVIVQ